MMGGLILSLVCIVIDVEKNGTVFNDKTTTWNYKTWSTPLKGVVLGIIVWVLGLIAALCI